MNPFARGARSQRGQSMAEFIVALAVLLPLFLAISYAGRYGDLQQAATQASRYAAYQRFMQPQASVLSDAKIEDQMRARFFVAGDYLNRGRLQSDDSAAALRRDQGQSMLWRDLGGSALLASPAQVSLRYAASPLSSGAVATAMGVMTSSAGKSYPGAHTAQVEVALVNKMDQARARPAPLLIAAATATVGNGLGSAGSKDTRDAASVIVPTSYVPDLLSDFLQLALGMFEPEGPVIGCIKPDVVPTGRLDGTANNSQCM